MNNFFNDKNASSAYEYMAYTSSKERKKKKEKLRCDPLHSTKDFIILLLSFLFIGIPLLIHYFG